ncbi:tumor necrosis factor receptor superfamily member 14-like [Myotis yumanensis]|uniref:tumor necrosis factor receptor superfamily member 14-like n=1 Tax=Myotis yumanensis TaxID=159337 RepID=UPI0038D07705
MTHYQSLLLNPPRVRFLPSAALNPATLLPDPDLDAPLHDCAGILEQASPSALWSSASLFRRLPGHKRSFKHIETREPGVQALSLLLLTAPPCTLGKPWCKEEEFPMGAMCCPKCRPGYRVQEACGELWSIVCVPCTRGTYTAHLNALHECLPCRVCDPGLGQVTRWNCTTRTNTVCGCGHGHFCERQDGDACVQCRPHSVCRPGQRVWETGTEWQDTLCEDCKSGTFSAGGTQAACTPWTRCSGPLAWEATPGTSSSDVTCSPWGPVIIVVSVILVIVVISVPLVLMSIRDRTSRGSRSSWFHQGSGPSSLIPDTSLALSPK